MDHSKYVFFDIDGTLLDREGHVSESAGRAIRMLRENGHKALLCSGRTRGYIREEEVLSIGFDGIVSGCGTEIEYEGKILLQRLIEPEEALRVVRAAKKHAFPSILEGPRYLYMDAEEFEGDAYAQRLSRVMGEDLLSIRDSWGQWEFSKFSCVINPETRDAFFADFAEGYDAIFHNDIVAEIIPKGFDKSTGMAWLCEHLGVDREDTFAFGDGMNDIGMFDWAGTGIAMGNGQSAAKEAADYVTDDMHKDGVANALEHFGLI